MPGGLRGVVAPSRLWVMKHAQHPPTHWSRRQFLAMGAAGATTLATGGANVFAATTIREKPRVAVLGCGQRGLAQLRRLTAAGANVVLAADPCAEGRAGASRAGARAVTEDVVTVFRRSDVDAVLIATPDATHGPLAERVVAVGKHVYIERPLAMNRDAAQGLDDLARRQGVVAAVGVETPGWAGWQAAADWVRQGALGPVRWVQVNDVSGDRGQRHAQCTWRADAAQHAGVFADPFFDMLAPVVLHLRPGPLQMASAAGGAEHGRGARGHMMATLKYAQGLTVVLHTGAPAPDGAIAVLRGRDASVRVFTTHAERWPEEAGAAPLRQPGIACNPLDQWLAAIASGGRAGFGLAPARETQHALEAAHGAWRRVATPLTA